MKLPLGLIAVLLLPYSANIQALSAVTAQVIHGSAPYLTFDNGVTKVTTTDGLLGITISDGTTRTTYTPANNTSTAAKPIVLPVANQSFADIGMLVPTDTNSIPLNTLIGTPYNYWGDDDGDGQGTNGIMANGYLSVSITDKDNQVVSRSATLDICQAPYKVELTSTAGSLATQYGVPNKSNFNDGTATYYINPKAEPKICYARPNLFRGEDKQAGPINIWSPTKGFLVQSTESSGYSRNFPTTGLDYLYFDLDIGGINGSTLIWPRIIQGGITVSMTSTPSEPNNIRVLLTGPAATTAQQISASPDRVATPTLPQTFEIVGYDSSYRRVLSYGFVLKQWFVNRGNELDVYANQSSWCTNIGYRMPEIKDLTNAIGNSWTGGMPSSNGNWYQRNIGAGLFTEWGFMLDYTNAGFKEVQYWSNSSPFIVGANGGYVSSNHSYNKWSGICTYP